MAREAPCQPARAICRPVRALFRSKMTFRSKKAFFRFMKFLCWPEKGLFRTKRALSGRLRAFQVEKGSPSIRLPEKSLCWLGNAFAGPIGPFVGLNDTLSV